MGKLDSDYLGLLFDELLPTKPFQDFSMDFFFVEKKKTRDSLILFACILDNVTMKSNTNEKKKKKKKERKNPSIEGEGIK